MSMIMIGTSLRAARKALYLTQAEVARRAGIGRATLSRLENGTIEEIGIRKVIRVCSALGLELHVGNESPLPTLNDLLREQRQGRS